MRTIGAKLTAGFLLLVILMVALALYAVLVSRSFLAQTVGATSAFSAEDMLSAMDRILEMRVEQVERTPANSWRRQLVETSNEEFARSPDVEALLDRRAREWSAGGGMSLKEMQANALSVDLRGAFIEFFERKYGSPSYTHALITNRYGAVIACAGGTPAYRQDSLPWWKATHDNGHYVGDPFVDPSSGIPVIPIGARIEDTAGRFVGALLALAVFEPIVRTPIIANKRYETTQIKLLTGSGFLLYSTKAFQFMENVSGRDYATRASNTSGYFRGREGGKEILYSYARSRPNRGESSQQWVLLMGHDAAEVLKPSSQLQMYILLASAVLVLAGAAAAFLISRSISRPVKALIEATDDIAQGGLGRRVEIRSRDEIGALSETFNQMSESMRGIVALAEKIASGDLTVKAARRSETDVFGAALEQMVANLRAQVNDILEAAGGLSSASSQIFSSITQLATAATETAASVSETSATVEQAKQTAHLSSQKAGLVSDSSQHSVEVADSGREAVGRTRDLLDGIKEQMESIARNILALSEQSQAIGDIVTSVNDLSDQSRLLAVNAAIEASKAGEHGRGFAVVAQEIKSLSEQSKKATAQVKSLLGDIQKATNAAVMAMERGSKAMDTGREQAAAADESIQELAQSIDVAAQAATQIAASSHQQLAGMDQVALAMVTIKDASEENVQSTKQLEAQVQNLYNLSQKLKKAAERYRLS